MTKLKYKIGGKSMIIEMSLLIKNYAWSFLDSCSDYKYIKIVQQIAYFKVVMYSRKLFRSYSRNEEHTTDSKKIFFPHI